MPKSHMAINFFPRVIRFFDLFKKQNVVLVESIHLLEELFTNNSSVKELCKKIINKEIEGNRISRDISISLAKTFITPIDREDIHDVNMAQEKTLNAIRSVSSRVGLYNLNSMKSGARDLIRMLKDMHEEIAVMIRSLEKKRDIEINIEKVKQLKAEADLLLLVSIGEIYESQPVTSSDFLELVKWSHIYDHIEEVYARSEVLANIVEGISLKYA